MKKNMQFFFVLVLSCTATFLNAQEMNPQMEAFLNRIDGANLNELEKELDEGIEGLKGFMGFFQNPGGDIKIFTADEERFSEPFSIDTSVAQIATKQFSDMGFSQVFKEGKSHIKFEKIGNDYWNTVSLTEGIEEWYAPKKVYFKDGTSTTELDNDNKVSFFWEEEWGEIKVIDSIEVDYNIRYTAAYDSLILNKKTKKLNYKDGVIKVEKLEKNHLYVTISDAYANGFYLRALNSDGKPLSENSSSFSPTSDNKSSDGITAILSLLEDVQSRLKKKKFKEVAQLKKYLIKQVSKIEETKDTGGVSHRKYYFNGNIDTVKLYIETEEGSQTVPFTATNNNRFSEILLNQTKEHLTFLDAQAKEIFQIESRPLDRIGERIFLQDETYYYLNMLTKNLDSLEAIKVFEASNGLVFIQHTMENGFLAFNSDLKQLSELEFSNVWSIDNEYVHTLGHDKGNYAIDANGKIKKIEGVSEIGKLSEGLLMAKLNGKYGFIDASGKVIVPPIYNDAELFSEGLAAIMNEDGLHGFINTKGEIILPLIYERADSFENGIAMVADRGGYQLIDKKGKVLVNSNSSGYFINGSGVQKTFTFGNKKYDAFGKLISEETK